MPPVVRVAGAGNKDGAEAHIDRYRHRACLGIDGAGRSYQPPIPIVSPSSIDAGQENGDPFGTNPESAQIHLSNCKLSNVLALSVFCEAEPIRQDPAEPITNTLTAFPPRTLCLLAYHNPPLSFLRKQESRLFPHYHVRAHNLHWFSIFWHLKIILIRTIADNTICRWTTPIFKR